MRTGVDFFVACDELRGLGWDMCGIQNLARHRVLSLLLELLHPLTVRYEVKSTAVMCECVYPTQWPAAAVLG